MKLKYLLFFCFSFIIFNSSLLIGTVRYVSKSGTSTPPYTSWATAADSIQKCINICSFGDTVYVANGIYKEKVVMIEGLTLIGSGMDDCIIDTRDFLNPWSVTVFSHCTFSNFKIVSPNEISNKGTGIFLNYGENEKIYLNKIESGSIGISHSNSIVEVSKNIITNVDYGIYSYDYVTFPNAELIINNNIISASKNSMFLYSPNIIQLQIFNNLCFSEIEEYGIVIDTVEILNNLILTPYPQAGIATLSNKYLILNNHLQSYPNRSVYGTLIHNSILENTIISNFEEGIHYTSSPPLTSIIKYNLFWENEDNLYYYNLDSTNLKRDPMIVNIDSMDLHLQKYSPAIDAGDPIILDVDGSRSDIGVFGGPYGEKYTYRDLAPKPPSNLTAVMDSGLVKLTWNKNTEADFSVYRVYRDTVPDFMYDTTKIVAVLSDTVYYDDPPQKFISGNYYYKITALDNALHQSAPSEEAHINITGIPEAPPIVVEHYRLLNNYPNPFNSSTIIPYRLKEGGYVKLYIYDMKGELVRVLVNGNQSAGYYEVRFNPSETERTQGELGEGYWTGYNDDIASGMYIYQLHVRGEGDIPVFTDMKKMILLK